MVALDHACGRNADDAAMPTFAIDHDAVGLAQRRIAADALFDGAQNAALFFLPIGVEAVELSGQQTGCASDLSR